MAPVRRKMGVGPCRHYGKNQNLDRVAVPVDRAKFQRAAMGGFGGVVRTHPQTNILTTLLIYRFLGLMDLPIIHIRVKFKSRSAFDYRQISNKDSMLRYKSNNARMFRISQDFHGFDFLGFQFLRNFLRVAVPDRKVRSQDPLAFLMVDPTQPIYSHSLL